MVPYIERKEPYWTVETAQKVCIDQEQWMPSKE